MGRFLQRIFGDHHQNQSCSGNSCGQAMYDSAYSDSNSGNCAPRPVHPQAFYPGQAGQPQQFRGQQPGYVDCNQGYYAPVAPQQFRGNEGVRHTEYRDGKYSSVVEQNNPYKPKSEYNEDTFTDAANRAAKEGKPLVVVVGNENDPRTREHLSRAWGAQQGSSEVQGRPETRHYYKDDAIFVNVDPAKVKEGSVLAGVMANQQLGKDSAPATLVLGTSEAADGTRLHTQQRFNNPAQSFGIIGEIDRAKTQLKPLSVTYKDAVKPTSDSPVTPKPEETKPAGTKPADKPEAKPETKAETKAETTPADLRKRVMEALSQENDPETRAKVMRVLDEIEAEKAKAKDKGKETPRQPLSQAEIERKAKEAANSQPVDLFGDDRNGGSLPRLPEKPAANPKLDNVPVPNPPQVRTETAPKPRETTAKPPAPGIPGPELPPNPNKPAAKPETPAKPAAPAQPRVEQPAAPAKPAEVKAPVPNPPPTTDAPAKPARTEAVKPQASTKPAEVKPAVPVQPRVEQPAAPAKPVEAAKPAVPAKPQAKVEDLGPDAPPKVQTPKPEVKPDAIDPRALNESVFQYQMSKIRGFDDFYKNETSRQDKAIRSINAAGTNSAEAAKLLGYDDMNLIGHRQFEAKVKDQYHTLWRRSSIRTAEDGVAQERADQWEALRKNAGNQEDPNYLHKQYLLYEIAGGRHIAYKEGTKVSNYNEDRDADGKPLISSRGTWQIEATEKLAEIAKDPKLNHEVVARVLPELLRHSQVPQAAKLKALEGVVALAQDKTSSFMDVRTEEAKKNPSFPYADGKPRDVAVASIVKAMHADNNSYSGQPDLEFQEAALKSLVQLKAVDSINQLRTIQAQTVDAKLRDLIGKYADKITDAAKPEDSAAVERAMRAQMQQMQKATQPAAK